MKSKPSSQPKPGPISRRDLIRGTAAAALLAATPFTSISALADEKKKPANRKNKAGREDKDAFPIMAAWLAFTTSTTIHNVGNKPGSLGVPPKVVQPFANIDSSAATPPVFATYQSLFDHVRTLFQKGAADGGYTGPECPAGMETLKVVADLQT